MKITNPKKDFRLQKYLNYHASDSRQISLIKNLKSEDFFQNSHLKGKETDNLNYKYLPYIKIHDLFDSLSQKYPKLILTYTAQEKYKLPNPVGDCGGKR